MFNSRFSGVASLVTPGSSAAASETENGGGGDAVDYTSAPGLYDRSIDRVKSAPGVRDATISLSSLAGGGERGSAIYVPGYAPRPSEQHELPVSVLHKYGVFTLVRPTAPQYIDQSVPVGSSLFTLGFVRKPVPEAHVDNVVDPAMKNVFDKLRNISPKLNTREDAVRFGKNPKETKVLVRDQLR